MSCPACRRSQIHTAPWKFQARAAEDATRDGHLADVNDRGGAADPGDLTSRDIPIPAAITLASSATRRRSDRVGITHINRRRDGELVTGTGERAMARRSPPSRPRRRGAVRYGSVPSRGANDPPGLCHLALHDVSGVAAAAMISPAAGSASGVWGRSPVGGPPRLDGANLFADAKSPAPSR
jgi:hypothetical protein